MLLGIFQQVTLKVNVWICVLVYFGLRCILCDISMSGQIEKNFGIEEDLITISQAILSAEKGLHEDEDDLHKLQKHEK